MLFLILIFVSANLMASPFKPQDHEVILELLPQQTLSNTQKLQQQFNKNPDNLSLAIQLAKEYISDSRYQGYAQAVLKKWWNLENIPIPVLLLRINLYQKQHKFTQALQDLTKLLSINQNNNHNLASRLRIIIARKKLNISSQADIKYLQANFEIEKARFLLTIEQDLSHAFSLAKNNWAIQKEPYAHLKFSTDCNSKIPELSINYNLFFQRNVLHRGFLTIENKKQYNYMFSPKQNKIKINFQQNNSFK